MTAATDQTTATHRPRREGLGLSASRSILFLSLSLSLWLTATPALAGTLSFFEAASGPDLPRAIPAPASNVLLDIDYAPSTAEGGGFYGLSELTIYATGDLRLTPTGFVCQIAQCLYAPSPLIEGTWITITGTDDLAGEFSTIEDFLTVSVSGSNGYIVIAEGEYIDATGPGGVVGDIQTAPCAVLAEVPEPGFTALLAAGVALMAVNERRRRRSALR